MARKLVLVILSAAAFGFLFAGTADAQTLTWWVENASRKVLQDRAPQPSHAVVLEAARNEYEPFQVVIRADGGDLRHVDARMSDLVGPGGATIPYDKIKLYRAYYITLNLASGQGGQGDGLPGDTRAPGEYVDPLIPFYDPYNPSHPAVGTPFDVGKGRLQPIYGDIYVPPGTPPGDYHGLLRISVGGSVAAETPVFLHVWNFTLPKERRVATAYGFSFGGVLNYHGGADGAWDDQALAIMKNYERTLHDFRIDLTDVIQGPPYLPSPFFNFDANGHLIPPDYTAYDEQMGSRFDGTRFDDGIANVMANNGLFGPGNGRSMTDDQYIEASGDFARHLKQKGWFDRIYLYVHDEPWIYPGAYEAIAYDVALMKMADPDWVSRMMATNHWVRELQFSIGIWCPLTGNYDKWNWSQPEYGRADYQRLIGMGQRLWFYVCNATLPPYAGYDIDTVWGHEPRILMWSSWYEGATGFLYWHTNFWYHSDPWGTVIDVGAFPWVARTGDGMLVYPGDHNGTAGAGVGSPTGVAIDGPVISLRMLMTREGLEDWEYLLMAEDLGGKDYAKRLTETIYRQLGINPALYNPDDPPWTQDDNKIYDARYQLGQLIEAGTNPAPIIAPQAKNNGGGHGGCAMSTGSDSGDSALYAMILGAFAVMIAAGRLKKATGYRRQATGEKKESKAYSLLSAACRLLPVACCLLALGCGSSGHSAGNSPIVPLIPQSPAPIVYDHAFTNGQLSLGDIPADMSASGPMITNLTVNPDTLVVQGQSLMVYLTFSDLDGDIAGLALLLQIKGRDEYWVIGPDQFGGIINGTALVQLNVSAAFEPGAYILEAGLRDDAGHIGNIATTIFIVQRYSTPDVVTFTPGDGETNVPLNTPIRGTFSDAVMGETVTVTLTQNAVNIPGVTHLSGTKKSVTFVPGLFLLPGMEYVACITIGPKIFIHHFTTATPPAVPDLTGRVYSVTITPDKILEPVGAEILFWTLTFPPILVKIKTFDAVNNNVSSIGALSTGHPPVQDPKMNILRFPSAGAIFDNPFFSMGPSVLFFDLYVLSGGLIDTSVNIYDFTLTGNFGPNGNSAENVIITGYLDATELNFVVNTFMPAGLPFNVCINLPGSCDENNKIPFRAQNITGAYLPLIGDFYDLSVNLNPASVSGSTGGTVAVTGEYSINGDPTGTNTVTLTTTAGIFPNSGTTYSINTSGGIYSTTLTIAPGLSAGTKVIVTATASSPIGNLPRRAKIAIR